MNREDKDSIQDDYIDKLLQKIYGYTDEQILKDFEEAENDDGSYPDFPVYPDEFDRIWEDIQAERAERMGSKPEEEEAATVVELPHKVRKIRWKRVAITGIAACLVALSVCFVAVGKKSYFYRERGGYDNIILNNDTSIIVADDQAKAYSAIEKNLEIKPLKLGYMPDKLIFEKLEISNGKAIMHYRYEDSLVYFVQSKDITEASNNYKSDGVEISKVKNKWISKELVIKKEQLKEGTAAYETVFQYNSMYCWLFGAIEEDEFEKIVERITY